jgi:hypothetical protein
VPEVEITVPARPTVVPVPVAPIPTVTAPTVEVTTPVVSVVPTPSPRPMLEEWEAGLSEYETVFDFVGSIVYVGEAKGPVNNYNHQVWRIGRFNEADENPSAMYCNGGEFTAIWTNRTGYTYDTPV